MPGVKVGANPDISAASTWHDFAGRTSSRRPQWTPFGRHLRTSIGRLLDVRNQALGQGSHSYQGRLSGRIRTPRHRPAALSGFANSAIASA